jgi:hypothetical protein
VFNVVHLLSVNLTTISHFHRLICKEEVMNVVTH